MPFPSRDLFILSAIAALLIFVPTLSPASLAETMPNILWINAEDMSPHLGCYGHEHAITPNIDRLAAQGVVYRNAFATAPICSPSRSCLATGLYATSLGTQHLRCEVAIPEQVVPLATRLHERGYFCTNTGKSDYNFSPAGIWDAWNNELAPWNARQKGQPFFAFITIGETHEGRINSLEKYREATADLPDNLRHNPNQVNVPPFYPDTPEIRGIFARMYDLATVFDRKVGELMERLRHDGDLDNTILFVFGDHGNGLPRYKRWLNDSGLRVPLVVYVPEKWKSLSPNAPGTHTDRLVSFVDFPATAMSLAGAEVPPILQGTPFMGRSIAEPRQFVYGARSRADDMFEVSRSVFDGRYLYVRHFMPHLPYIPPSVIFDDSKSSLRELRRLHLAGELNEQAERMWAPHKPLEELYDLQADPHELQNLARSPELAHRKESLAKKLRGWIMEHRDSGFLPEAEYQIRAAQVGLTPFEIVQNEATFDLAATLQAAWRVGDAAVPPSDLITALQNKEAGVRYWSAVALLAREEADDTTRAALLAALADPSPSVRIAVAEALLHSSEQPSQATAAAWNVLGEVVLDDRPWVALQAARALALQGEQAKPLVPVMKQVIEKNRSEPGSRRPYKDFNYASFTGWALETALLACGEEAYVKAISEP